MMPPFFDICLLLSDIAAFGEWKREDSGARAQLKQLLTPDEAVRQAGAQRWSIVSLNSLQYARVRQLQFEVIDLYTFQYNQSGSKQRGLPDT